MKAPGGEGLAVEYSERFLNMILERGNSLPRTYGFEYEFLPHRILDFYDMSRLRGFLTARGYSHRAGSFVRGERQVVFEPGGQIEYLSPPLRADDSHILADTLDWIASTNGEIEEGTGIRYVGTDFIPGRYDAPLLLTSPRYSKMHRRFRQLNGRGPDMMKGTAAIHMHAAITSRSDLEALFTEFCIMSRSSLLGMSPRRREIWDHTDSCRCGLAPVGSASGAGSILHCIVDHAMDAVELRSGRVFREAGDRDFEDFLEHLTTIFTDVRVNAKGGTMELRTPDSRPVEEFPRAWNEFIRRCELVAGL